MLSVVCITVLCLKLHWKSINFLPGQYCKRDIPVRAEQGAEGLQQQPGSDAHCRHHQKPGCWWPDWGSHNQALLQDLWLHSLLASIMWSCCNGIAKLGYIPFSLLDKISPNGHKICMSHNMHFHPWGAFVCLAHNPGWVCGGPGRHPHAAPPQGGCPARGHCSTGCPGWWGSAYSPCTILA